MILSACISVNPAPVNCANCAMRTSLGFVKLKHDLPGIRLHSFHLMPVYVYPELLDGISPELT
jgi:hypothetical protein